MKKRVLPLMLVGVMTASNVPAYAAWTTNAPAAQPAVNATTFVPTGYSSVFNDIGGHWAQRFIEQWAANGVFGGMGNGSFSPNTTLTRAQFASVLMQLFDLQMVTEEDARDYRVPSDVTSSHWGRDAIAACLDNGIMNLRSGNFAPDQPITREEVFFSMGKAAKLDNLSGGNSYSLNRFSDGYSVSSAAQNVIAKMVDMGMLAGRGNGMLEPHATITRAEVSTVLSKAVTFVNSKTVKNETYSGAVIFNVDKNKSIDLTNVKVNGNMFIKGSDINEINLDNVTVNNGAIYIYADSIEAVNLEDVTDTDFIIVCPEVAFDDSVDADGNTFLFENAQIVDFKGEADKVHVRGSFVEEVTVNGSVGDGIEVLTIDAEDADGVDVSLSGEIEEVNINGDADITGYAKVKTMYLDEGDYTSTMAANKVKVESGKLKVAGETLSKGTYDRDEIKGAVTPDSSNSSAVNGVTGKMTYVLNSGRVPTIVYDEDEIFDFIKMDGERVSASNYDVSERYDTIDFDAAYLNSLAPGKHTVRVVYDNGDYDVVELTIETAASDYTFVKGTGTAPMLYVNNVYSTLYSVAVDGYVLSANEYVLNNGYLQINVNRLNALSTGLHNVRCSFTSGNQVTLTLNVQDNSVSNVVTPATAYHTKGSAFTTVHSYNSVYYPTYITMDGSVLATNQYALNTTAKTLTLATDYVNTLTAGNHTMRVYFADGKYTDVAVVISDEAQITSFIFDKTPSAAYNRNINVGGISSSPALVMVDNNVMSTSYYGYNSSTQEVILFKEYFANLATGDHRVVISYGNGASRTVNVVVQQSTQNATFVYDKNTASVNHRDIVITGNISNSELKVFVKNRQLNASEYTYTSGNIVIAKSVFEALDNSTCYVGVTSSAGTVSATVNVVNTAV